MLLFTLLRSNKDPAKATLEGVNDYFRRICQGANIYGIMWIACFGVSLSTIKTGR
jgi:hypothetical protein